MSVENVFCKVTRATSDEEAWLSSYLTFEDARAYFQGRSDNKVRRFNTYTKTFGTGFLAMLQNAAKREGIQIALQDTRKVPCVDDPKANISWLRDYQRDAVNTAVAAGRGILKLPTGAGKTELAVALTRRLRCNWLFLVHRTTLVEQAALRWELRSQEYYEALPEDDEDTEAVLDAARRLGVASKAGRIYAGVFDPQPGFTVATFQTLYKKLQQERMLRHFGPASQLLANAEGLMVDECHVMPADSFHQVAMACGAYYRIGFSATPFARGDKRSPMAVEALGKQIFELKAQVLQKAGVLSIPNIRFVEVVQQSQLTSAQPTPQGVKGELINTSIVRNNAVAQVCKKAAKPCLVFVEQLRHGQELKKRVLKAGVSCDFIAGAADLAQRQHAIERLVRREIEVLICTVIFQEGVDIPSLRSVVVAGGGKSIIATLQRIGRGMRVDLATGKSTFEVWDIMDRGQKWLERHSKARMNAYLKQGYKVSTDENLLF